MRRSSLASPGASSVQCRAPHQQLSRLPIKGARTDSLAKDHLHAKDSRLGQTAPMGITFSLPGRTPFAPDLSPVLITDVPLGLCIAVLPNLRSLLRWNAGPRFSLANRIIAVAAVIRAIGCDLRDFVLDLFQQVGKYLRVLARVIRNHHRHKLTAGARQLRGGVYATCGGGSIHVDGLSIRLRHRP